MPSYVSRGRLPRKRHIQFRENGTLLTEEVMGLEGFSGNESILYHLQSPCRVQEVAAFEPIVREEWVPDGHAHRHLRTHEVEPGGDPSAAAACSCGTTTSRSSSAARPSRWTSSTETARATR